MFGNVRLAARITKLLRLSSMNGDETRMGIFRARSSTVCTERRIAISNPCVAELWHALLQLINRSANWEAPLSRPRRPESASHDVFACRWDRDITWNEVILLMTLSTAVPRPMPSEGAAPSLVNKPPSASAAEHQWAMRSCCAQRTLLSRVAVSLD